MLIRDCESYQALLTRQTQSMDVLRGVEHEIDCVFASALQRAEQLEFLGFRRDLEAIHADIARLLSNCISKPFDGPKTSGNQSEFAPFGAIVKTEASLTIDEVSASSGLGSFPEQLTPVTSVSDVERLSRSLDVLEQFCDQISQAAFFSFLNAIAATQKIAHRAGADTFSIFSRICSAADGHLLPALERGISKDLLEEMASVLPCAEAAAWDEYEACQQRPPFGRSAPRKRRPSIIYSHSEREIPAVILKARSLTSGKTLFLVGGECRPEQKASIETLLDCAIKWLPSNGAASVKRIHTAGAGCDLLCALITLMRKGESAALNALHRDSGVPLVRVLAKVSATSIAAAICEQLMRE